MPANTASGTDLTVHYEDGTWWAESTNLPGWTAVADTTDQLNALLREAP